MSHWSNASRPDCVTRWTSHHMCRIVLMGRSAERRSQYVDIDNGGASDYSAMSRSDSHWDGGVGLA
eukprot:9472997-Pyramimonas_sp.AAC.2